MYKNVELRKLPMGALLNIAAILENNADWKKVMSLVPRNPRSDYFEPKYNLEHIKQIEDAAKTSNRKAAEILFEEWGTSGRIRPTLSTLKEVVQKAQIYRAADAIALMLEESPPTRPVDGPAAPIDTNISLLMEMSNNHGMNGTTAQVQSLNPQNQKSLGQKTTAQMRSASDMMKFSDDPNVMSMNIPDISALDVKTENGVDITSMPQDQGYQTSFPNITVSSTHNSSTNWIAPEILTDEKLIHFQFRELEIITKRFAERLSYTPDPHGHGKLAGKIGSGGFGDVFVGFHPNHGHLAIKKTKNIASFDRKPDIAMRVFNAEVKFLSQFRHKNIVPIIGFSKDGPCVCIVCEYIDGGSLEQKLAAKILTEKQRLNILIGTAEGLKYLHGNEKLPEDNTDNNATYRVVDSDPGAKKNNFLHGDVKTANILLTRDCVPKLCDFGLAKQYDKTFITTSPMGTSAYMAPEGFQGTITQKIDIYSYGIVMLEVLTGLRPLITLNNGERLNIKDYIEETSPQNEITSLLDPFIDKWTKAKELYALARNCLERQRKSRPTSEDIVDRLYEICGIEKSETKVEVAA